MNNKTENARRFIRGPVPAGNCLSGFSVFDIGIE
jgi:hypothetical protein